MLLISSQGKISRFLLLWNIAMSLRSSSQAANLTLAFCLVVLFGSALAKPLGLGGYGQFDFWVLCVLVSVLFGLPLTIMELALAKRTRITPLVGLMQLTRDADVSPRWRMLGWIAVAMMVLVGGGLLHDAMLLSIVPHQLNMGWLMYLILCIVAFGLSLIPRQWLIILTGLATVLVVILGFSHQVVQTWTWTDMTWLEWSKAVIMSMVTSGLGWGLYWTYASQQSTIPERVTKDALSIWFMQLLGLVALAIVQNHSSEMVQQWLTLVAVLGLTSLLLQTVREQLVAKNMILPIQALILLLPLFIWIIPLHSSILYFGLCALGLSLVLSYAIFVAWRMKISHVRKGINFSNEAIYNLWRIIMRIGLPIAMILAVVGWVAN